MSNKNIKLMMCTFVQNGDINHKIQVIEQNGKNNRLFSLIHIFDIKVDDTIRYDVYAHH